MELSRLKAGSGGFAPRVPRVAALGCTLLAAVVALLAVGNPFVSATSGGDPYSVPLVQDTNPDPGIVETTLIAEEATVDIGNGVSAHAQTFNGTIPGPTFRLKVGDTVIVHYENHLSRASGIHWHGIELANGEDGTPFTQGLVEPGKTFLYKFTVTRPGIYWYHPHHHSSTNQLFKGLYGMILVEDPDEATLQESGKLPPPSLTRPIVLSDITVCKAPGSNDSETYDPGLPHVSGAKPLPAQQPPTPQNLCEGPGLAGPPVNPYPVDEDGVQRAPFAAGDVPNIQTAAHAGLTNEGQTVLTNGRNVGGRAGGPCTPGGGCPAVTPPGALAPGASVLDVRPGQGLRLQLLNASTVRYMRLQLTAPNGDLVPLIRVGGEGGLLNDAVVEGGTKGTWNTKYQAGEILLPPGGRADVVAAIPTTPTAGVMTLWTEDFPRTGLGYASLPTVPVMHLNLVGPAVFPTYSIADGTALRSGLGNPVEVLGAPNGIPENPATFTPPKPGLPDKTIDFTDSGGDLGVDDVFGTHDVSGYYGDAPHLGSSRYVEQGETLELELRNMTGLSHPFHPHGFSIQPISLSNGGATETYTWPYPEFRDTVDIPSGFTLTYRVRIDPRPLADGSTPGGALGRWVLHCHIFFHAVDGMLSEVVVTGPNGNERPNVDVDDSEPAVARGGIATVTGTFDDPDGDPVTLSASVGSVTSTGGGRYTWAYPTTESDGSRLVYVTATDSNGLKGQIPFHLTVDGAPNSPPTIGKLRVVPKRFVPVGAKRKRAHAGPSTRKRRGAQIRFSISEPAKAQFTIKRLAPRRPRLKPRTFSRRLGSGGAKAIRFSGRLRKLGPLPRGKYKLTARATDLGGLRSRPVSTRFRIIR